MVEQKRFALLQAVPDSEFVKEKYGGYFNVFVSAYGDEGEQWDLFRVVDGEFPDEKDLEKYEGFVISGSSHDAFANNDWILKLCDLCRKLDEMKKKVLGICFGLQIICRIRGGKVGRAHKGLDLGIRDIKIVKELIKPGSYFGDEIPASLAIIKCHQDEVLEPPESAKVIGYSDDYDVEMLYIDDHFFCIQGHPEYTKDILFEIVDRVSRRNLIPKEAAEKAKASALNAEPDRKRWETLCKNFLKGRSDLV